MDNLCDGADDRRGGARRPRAVPKALLAAGLALAGAAACGSGAAAMGVSAPDGYELEALQPALAPAGPGLRDPAAGLSGLLPVATGTRAAAPTGNSALFRPAALDSPIRSGLAWRSGSSCPETGIGNWRGRPLDVTVTFTGIRTWDAITANINSATFRSRAGATPQFVVTMPMLPTSEDGRLASCAAGAFDGRFRELGALLARNGAGRAVVRLGWEANHVSRPYAPAAEAEIPAYVGCFRREAAALRAAAPGLRIEWTMGRRSTVPFAVTRMYPGDDAVDHLGVHYYDNVAPKMATQSAWDQHYAATYKGGPAGLGTWLREAKARGKKLAVSEWGVWDQGSVAAADNPLYVANMHRFFRANAATIAYENYFNCPLEHQLHPSTRFPRARGEYRQLW